MRYNSYSFYFRRSDNKCYEILYEGFIKPFIPDKNLFSVQFEGGKYMSRDFDLPAANATVYSVRVAVREDSPFFNYDMIWSVTAFADYSLELDNVYSLRDSFGKKIQSVYSKEIQQIIDNAIEI